MQKVIPHITRYWQRIDARLDQIGMYRVVTLALLFLVVCSLALGTLGLLPYGPVEQLLSLASTVVVALGLNVLCAKLWRVHANHESALITALILFFLIVPASLARLELTFIIVAATAVAILSKYVIAWRRQHILNPAAAGAVGLAALYALYPLPPGYFESGWWIAQPALFLPLLLAGSLVVTKVRKWQPVMAFLGVAFVVFLFEEWRFSGEVLQRAPQFWLSGPSLFLAFFMLTEPFTSPPTTRLQNLYGGVVGFLSQTTLFLPVLKMTPELALLIGNVAFFPSSLRQKLFLELIEKRRIARDTYEFLFKKPAGLRFSAGQYLEWMLPHTPTDARGVRRYFTIASAPSESVLRLALKVMPDSSGSTYKDALCQLDAGEAIIASQLAGDFTLPADRSEKLGFIAGGIGVTPFVSHVHHMLDSDQTHDTVLYYCNNTCDEIAYHELWERAAAQFAFSIVHMITEEAVEPPYEHGFITLETLERRTPDYGDRRWYLSGPPGMVNAYERLLREAGVPRRQIVKDFFPGLA